MIRGMVYHKAWLALAVLTLLLSACASQTASPTISPPMGGSSGAYPNGAGSFESDKAVAPGAPAAEPQAQSGRTDNSAVERLVIKNASINIVVEDPSVTADVITKMADDLGGYVVSSNNYKRSTSQGVEVPEATITLRVPAEKLNDALETIRSQVKDRDTDIQNESVSGQDVTKEYTDLNSQLRNLQQAEAQLQKIMEEARATDDVLNVYQRLTEIRGQIEMIQGQIKYYEESAAMSSIQVQVIAAASIQPLTVAGWEPVGVARDAVQALIDAFQAIGNIAIWAALFCLPIALVLGVPLYFILRGLRRWQKNRRPAAPQPEPGD